MTVPPPTPAYREHAPHPALDRHIECYWTLTGRLVRGACRADAVLPDGCMDVLLSPGEPPRTSSGPGHRCSVVGTMTHALDVTYAGDVRLVGIRFRPGGASAYLGVPAVDLTDRSAPLDELWGREADELLDRLAGTSHDRELTSILDDTLMTRADGAEARTDHAVLRASRLLADVSGRATVDRLAAAAGLGRRQLERRFLAAVGMPPKLACRVARFREAVRRLHAEPGTSLSRVALDAGFADQAHFTRDFRTLAGVSPGAYRRERVPDA